jgi:hypothetical protein
MKDNTNKKEENPIEYNKSAGINDNININNALLVIIIVLIVMSTIQVFQMHGLLKAISNGNIKVGTQTESGGSIGLPSQVGGCG